MPAVDWSPARAFLKTRFSSTKQAVPPISTHHHTDAKTGETEGPFLGFFVSRTILEIDSEGSPQTILSELKKRTLHRLGRRRKKSQQLTEDGEKVMPFKLGVD